MRLRNYVVIAALLLAAPLFGACNSVSTGVEDFLDDLSVSGEIATIVCPATMIVGQVEILTASNVAGTNVSIGGFVLAIWESSAPAIIVITTDGEITALAVGSATITARGTNNSSDSCIITVA